MDGFGDDGSCFKPCSEMRFDSRLTRVDPRERSGSAFVTIEGKVTGAKVQLHENPWKIDMEIQTTFRGYEVIKISLESPDSEKTLVLQVFRHDVLLTSLRIEADVYPNRPLIEPIVKVDLKATESIWAKFELEMDEGKGKITFSAPNKDFKLEFEGEDNGDTSLFTAHMELDGKTLDYESERVWTDGRITGKSSYTTTMDYEPANQKSNYEIQWPFRPGMPYLLR